MKKPRNIVIRIDRPPLKPEQIKQYKSFNQFIGRFYKIHTASGFRWMLRHNIKKLVLLIIIALLLLLWYLGEL